MTSTYRDVFNIVLDATDALPSLPPIPPLPETNDGKAAALGPYQMWGWLMRTIRNGEAVFALIEAGHEHETSPLLRSSVEHAMYMQWLTGQDLGLATKLAMKKTAANRKRIEEAIQKEWDFPPEVFESLKYEMPSWESDPKEWAIFKTFAEVWKSDKERLSVLYIEWCKLSGDLHVGQESSAPYIRVDEQSNLVMPLRNQRAADPEKQAAAARTACRSSILALDAYAKTLDLTDYVDVTWQNIMHTFVDAENHENAQLEPK
jgi:hypothetical protein